MTDPRSNRIVVVSHCIMNVHSLEDGLAEYPGLEEDILMKLMEKKVGIVQLRCPETRLHGIQRLPMPKDTYDKPEIRKSYAAQAREEILQLREFVENGAEVVAVIGAEASPSCGIEFVGRWKEDVPVEARSFPDDVDFIEGRGVFMEELEKALAAEGIRPKWIGVPGKSLKRVFPEIRKRTIHFIQEEL